MATKRFGKARPSGEPSGSTERKIRILLELIRNKFVRTRVDCWKRIFASKRSAGGVAGVVTH